MAVTYETGCMNYGSQICCNPRQLTNLVILGNLK